MINPSRLLFTVIIAVGVGTISGCGKEESSKKPVVRPVKAVRVADPSGLSNRAFPGRAKATQEVDLSFRVSGPLITRPVNVGDEVKKGQVLATIDPRDFEVDLRNVRGQLQRARAQLAAMRQARPEDIRKLKAAVEKAEAALKLADTDYQRVISIKAKDPGAVSQEEIDRRLERKKGAEAELRQAEEELRIGQIGARPEDIAAKEAEIRSLQASEASRKDQLRYTELRAPFDGTIVATYVENFEYVQSKQPIVRLVDTSRIEMVVNIPENLISLAPYVEKVWVRFDPFPEREIPATIKEIGKEASETTRTYPVTLIMDQPDGFKVLPGMAGRTTLVEGQLPGQVGQEIEVPVSAIFSPDETGKTYVWVIDEETITVQRREVKTDMLTDRGVKITEGLKPGELIATAGVHYLREGQQVKIL
jgi:multidrug efflux pump subunit AcrA (membrane-fusion protein)